MCLVGFFLRNRMDGGGGSEEVNYIGGLGKGKVLDYNKEYRFYFK